MEAARRDVAVNYFFQSRFVDRYLSGFELSDFFGVIIDANHMMADIGEASARHQTDVSGADNRDVHGSTMVLANKRQHKSRNLINYSGIIQVRRITGPPTRDRSSDRSQISEMPLGLR